MKRKAEKPEGVNAKKPRTEKPDIEDHNSEEQPAAEEVDAHAEEQPAAEEVAADAEEQPAAEEVATDTEEKPVTWHVPMTSQANIVGCCAVCVPCYTQENSLFVPVFVHVFLPLLVVWFVGTCCKWC